MNYNVKMLGLECGPSCQKKMLQNFGFAIEIKMLTKHKQSKCFHLVWTTAWPWPWACPLLTPIPQSFSFEIALLLHNLYKSLLLFSLHHFILHVASMDSNLEGNEHVLEPIYINEFVYDILGTWHCKV